MNIFVYSDESGLFDKEHNDVYVFGGLIFFDKERRDICTRKYSAAEKVIRARSDSYTNIEIKAASITNSEKGRLFRSLNQEYKFGVIIDQKRIHERIYHSKKDKQRYLDYAYKIGLKSFFNSKISDGTIKPEDVRGLYVYVDEHTTATNGRYELQEGLEQEFKNGTFNYSWQVFHKPIFPKMQHVSVEFCNSEKRLLIRGADIIANRFFHHATNGKAIDTFGDKTVITKLP